MKRLRVLTSRREISPQRLDGATVVVIDVLLATTTLLAIAENGARRVFPVESLEEADRVHAKLDDSRVLRGGEQGGDRVDGYDFGPLPEEYPPEVVSGKEVVFLTTNGTRAIADAAGAEKVLTGCLRNAPAVARRLEESGTESVYLLCAGSGGRFSLEDFLGAALIASRMDLDEWRLNDAAWLALDIAGRYSGEPLRAIEQGRVGRWFREYDRMETLEFVAEVGASDLVPEVVDGVVYPETEVTDEAG